MKVIITGSFDPITLGHMEIIKYAAQKYETVYVVALINETKKYTFTLEQKKRLIELAVEEYNNVIVDAYAGYTADYMHKHGITHIIRGVRNDEDVEYEKNLAEKMKQFDNNFETEIVSCNKKFVGISSTYVRNCLSKGESIKNLVPDNLIDEIKEMYRKNN